MQRLSLPVIFLVIAGIHAYVWECELPGLFKECYDFYSRIAKPYNTPPYAIQSRCINSYLWKTSFVRYYNNFTPEGLNYIKSLQREIEVKKRHYRYKRQTAEAPVVRREIRTLSDTEREAFYNAVNTLKNDGSYDNLANMHTGNALQSGHEGPAFLSWHREYLLMLETALRRVDPSVALPYWDSRMDFDMENPTDTSFFSSALVGNGDGIVINGPFAEWPARTDGRRLARNIGVVGSLLTTDGLNMFLNDPTINRTSQIVVGTGIELPNTLEGQHNNVHNWVGRDMSGLETAAHDPVFFLFHAHIDYIWERFREKQVALGSANPETDYPIINTTLHHPDRPMDGFANVTNIGGYSNRYTRDLYTYANPPECANGCGGSRFLRCSNLVNRCVALTAAEVGGASDTNQNAPIDMGGFEFPTTFNDPRTRFARSTKQVRKKRDNYHIQRLLTQTPNLSKQNMFNTDLHEYSLENRVTRVRKPKYGSPRPPIKPSTRVLERGQQNLFSMDGVADITRWAYIPVRIINERDIFSPAFKSPLVLHGQFVPGADPYNPLVYNALRPLFQFNKQKMATFPTCARVDSGVKKVYFRSDGLTYAGNFEDYAVIDERQPISETIAYVAVKHPKFGPGKAMITAYDSSGRVCEPKCLVPGTLSPSYRSCSGIIGISDLLPKMYGDDYGEAVRNQWNFVSGNCPSQQSSPVFLTFYCSPSVQWPWKKCLNS